MSYFLNIYYASVSFEFEFLLFAPFLITILLLISLILLAGDPSKFSQTFLRGSPITVSITRSKDSLESASDIGILWVCILLDCSNYFLRMRGGWQLPCLSLGWIDTACMKAHIIPYNFPKVSAYMKYLPSWEVSMAVCSLLVDDHFVVEKLCCTARKEGKTRRLPLPDLYVTSKQSLGNKDCYFLWKHWWSLICLKVVQNQFFTLNCTVVQIPKESLIMRIPKETSRLSSYSYKYFIK